MPKEESPILHLGAKPDVLPRGSGCPRPETSHSNASFGPKPMAARQTSPSTPQSCLSRAGEHQGQGKTPALKHGLTKGSCWGGFSALCGCFSAQVIGYSSQNLTSCVREARRQAQGRVIQHQIVGFEGLFKKRNSKVLRVSPTDFASNTLVFKYCVQESSPRATSCTL